MVKTTWADQMSGGVGAHVAPDGDGERDVGAAVVLGLDFHLVLEGVPGSGAVPVWPGPAPLLVSLPFC